MKLILSAVLFGAFTQLAIAQVAVLHIRVTEGEGAVNAAGAHNTRPLAVEVTDETGKPVEGASVSFHLPDEGPGGTFGNGLRTDVTVTDSRGRANLHTMLLNRTPGRFAIRILASKEQARAGMESFQYVADSSPKSVHSPLKWVVIAVLAGGAAAAAAVVASRSGSAPPAASGPSTTGTSTVSIGSPTVTVGKP